MCYFSYIKSVKICFIADNTVVYFGEVSCGLKKNVRSIVIECSIYLKGFKLADNVQMYIFNDICLLVLPITEEGLLMSPSTIVNFFISA